MRSNYSVFGILLSAILMMSTLSACQAGLPENTVPQQTRTTIGSSGIDILSGDPGTPPDAEQSVYYESLDLFAALPLPGLYVSVNDTRIYREPGATTSDAFSKGSYVFFTSVFARGPFEVWGKIQTGFYCPIRIGNSVYFEYRLDPGYPPIPDSPAEAGRYKITQIPNTVWNGIGMGYFIQTPNGKTVVIDGGFQNLRGNQTVSGFSNGEETNVRGWLSKNAGNKVDAWFITHPHNDHIRVAAAIFRNPKGIQVEKVFASLFPKDQHDAMNFDETPDESAFAYDAIEMMKTAGKYGELSVGETFEIDGLAIEVLSAASPDFRYENDNSCVLKFTFGDTRKTMLVLGDIAFKAADALVARYGATGQLSADILQATHHGLEYLDELYRAISPKYVFIPTGLINVEFNPEILTNIERFERDFGAEVIVSYDRWTTLVVG